MLERLKWPGLALLLGGLGALVRRWQLASAFEGELGLQVPGAPASLALLAFLILSAAVFFLMAHSAPCKPGGEGWRSQWDFAFAAERDVVYLTAMVLAGLLTLAAAPFLFREAAGLMALRKMTGEGENGLLQVVLSLCTIPAAAALVISARAAYRMKGRGRENGLLLLPVLLCCIWLLEAYRANAANPVVWDYAPLLLAIGLSVLFYLDCAGLSFETKGHARRMLWLAAMTVTVSAVALASAPGKSMALLLCGQMLSALAALWVAPGNLRRPPAADRFGLRARLRQGLPLEEQTADTEEQEGSGSSGTQEIQEEDTHV